MDAMLFGDADGVLTTWRDGRQRPALQWEAKRESRYGSGFDWDDFNKLDESRYWLMCLRRFRGVVYKRRWLGAMDAGRLPN